MAGVLAWNMGEAKGYEILFDTAVNLYYNKGAVKFHNLPKVATAAPPLRYSRRGGGFYCIKKRGGTS